MSIIHEHGHVSLKITMALLPWTKQWTQTVEMLVDRLKKSDVGYPVIVQDETVKEYEAL